MAGVEHRDFSAPDETRTPDKTTVELVAIAEVSAGEPVEFGDVRCGNVAHCRPQFAHPLAGQRVVDAIAVTAADDQPGPQ